MGVGEVLRTVGVGEKSLSSNHRLAGSWASSDSTFA